MARRTVAAEPVPADTARKGRGALPVLTFLLAGYAAVVGTVLLLRGGPSGVAAPAAAPDLDARLAREASRVRGEVQDDLKKSIHGFQDAVEGAVRRIDAERSRLQAVADEASRRAADAVRGSTSRADVLEARMDEVAQQATALRGTVDGMALAIRDLSSRPAAAPAAPRPSPEAPPAAPGPATPRPPVEPDPVAPGPTPEQLAANKEKVRAAVAELSQPDVGRVFAACATLAKLGDLEAVEPLLKVLKEHKDPYARMAAVNAVGTLHACDAVPAVVAAFVDKDDAVVLAAALAFSKVTGQDSGLTGSPTRKEKNEAQDRWSKWWKEHEQDVRTRWNQPAGGAPPAGGDK